MLGTVFSVGQAQTTATQSISVPSGYSQTPVIDGKTVKIYAGWANAANNCNGASATSTCDTCLGGTDIPCNRASIHGNMYLQIDVSSTTQGIGGLPVQLSTDATTPTNNFTNVTAPTSTASGYSIRILWRDLCTGLPGIVDPSCGEASAPTGASRSIYFGPVKDAKFVEMITVEINLSVVGSTASNYTECPNGATTSEGAGCYFEVFGGDEKAYITVFEPSWNVDSPAIALGNASFPVRNIVFFAASGPEGTADSAIYNTITNSSDSFEIAVQSGEDPLGDNRLNDLQNGDRYCFKMATQDITGNILRYTPNTSGTTNKCAEPNDVAGILTDKECFIATAAFGSSLNRHVQKFREFRNQFLAGSEWGKKFIQVYYKYGSQAATVIKKHETLKTLVRGALWPLLIFVEISLQWGILWGVFSALLTLLVLRRTWQILKLQWLKRAS